MKKISLIFITMLVFLVYSCSPSVEGETKNWDRNVNELKQMQKDYPAYAEMINATIIEAEGIYNQAKTISDEEAKAKKMREANNVLNSGCIGDLKKMNSKIDELDNKKSELQKILIDKSESEIKFAELILDDCKSAIKKAEKLLKINPDELDANPCLTIENAYKKLESVYKDTEETITSFNKQEKKKEEQLKAENDKKDEATKAIECTYCGTKNEAGSTKCTSCGANL